LLIAAVTGLLTCVAGFSVPTAVLAGGGAFSGSVALMLAIANYTNES
jgi:hypothetical protein